jgi:hypothetical protein
VTLKKSWVGVTGFTRLVLLTTQNSAFERHGFILVVYLCIVRKRVSDMSFRLSERRGATSLIGVVWKEMPKHF